MLQFVAVCCSVLQGQDQCPVCVHVCEYVHNTGLYDKLCEYGHYTHHTHTHTNTYTHISFARLITVSFQKVSWYTDLQVSFAGLVAVSLHKGLRVYRYAGLFYTSHHGLFTQDIRVYRCTCLFSRACCGLFAQGMKVYR